MSGRRNILKGFEENKDFFEKVVNEGIEKHRKGDCTLVLTDEDGSKISGAVVKIKQKSHEFRFGANLFMLDELESEEKNELYKKAFASVFNMATLPFYWNSTEPQRGQTRYDKNSPKLYRRPPIDLCIEYCNEYNIEPREHALAYEHTFPEWLKNASIDEIKEALRERYKQISDRYADKIRTIEVTNEMFWDDGVTALYKSPEYVEWCFKLAEELFPSNQLVINEFSESCWLKDYQKHDTSYYDYIKPLIERGARIDAIGLQYHMFYSANEEYEKTKELYDPIKLYKIMERYASFGKPLQITEITIPAYSNNPSDEQIQAEIIEKLYSLWFSFPNVEQIIYWNLIDGYAYVPNPTLENIKASQGNMTVGENVYYGGLFRFDMTPKPAYFTLMNLMHNKWHTEESIDTDADGVLKFRGFYGDYELEISYGDKLICKEIKLCSGKENTFNIAI